METRPEHAMTTWGSPKVEITARVLDIYSPLLRGERTGPHGSKVESHNGYATLTDPKWKATMETRPEHAMTTWGAPKWKSRLGC